jgi:hypothetical protein
MAYAKHSSVGIAEGNQHIGVDWNRTSSGYNSEECGSIPPLLHIVV